MSYDVRVRVPESPPLGEVTERFKVPVLKTGVGKPTVSSNLTFSAILSITKGKKMRQNSKASKAFKRLQAAFGSEVGFRFARVARGCVTHGQLFKKGDPHVEMDQKTWDQICGMGLVKESRLTQGSFYISG